MPTSAPGSSRARRYRGRPSVGRGFTLIELLIVIAIVALSVGLVALALPDGDAARLDEEGARLAALLEVARAESRTSGTSVYWTLRTAGELAASTDLAAPPAQFRFVGLPASLALPTRWLDPRVSAQVVGTTSLVLGPEAILPAQRVVLRLGDRRLELASDGLAPFAPVDAGTGVPNP